MTRSHLVNIFIPDLITVVSTKTTLDTTTLFIEADAIKTKVLSCIYELTNLSGVSFLTTGGGQTKTPAFIENKDRTKDLAFIRLSCTIDVQNLDCRVLQEALCLSFCLKLPQSDYDPSSGSITVFDTASKPTPIATISQPSTNLAFQFVAVSSTSTTSPVTSKSTPTPKIITISQLKPKMSHLLGLSSGDASSVVSYFRPVSFLDDQDSFLSIFGHKPQLFSISPSRLDAGGIGEKLRMYADKCMFNVFFAICREDYVGTDDGTSNYKMVYEICKRLEKYVWNGGLRSETAS